VQLKKAKKAKLYLKFRFLLVKSVKRNCFFSYKGFLLKN
jgi:hypothetical protein